MYRLLMVVKIVIGYMKQTKVKKQGENFLNLWLRGDETMAKSKLRGHEIECVNNVWYYCDTKEPTVENWKRRPCEKCNKLASDNGDVNYAYIQLYGGVTIRKDDAIVIMNILKKHREVTSW
jgi:hypothetical protein